MISHLIIQRMRQSHRISTDNAPMVQAGRLAADQYWNGHDRHPLTSLRRLLRLTDNAQQWLEARYGFHARLREIIDAA